MDKKRKILFVLPLPPPVHGSSMVAAQIRDNFSLPGIHADFINLSTSRKMGEVYHTGPVKVLRGIVIYTKVLLALLRSRYDLCYLAPAVSPGGLLKDIIPLLLFRLFRRRIVLHIHGKGIRRYQNRRWMDFLYRLLFRNSKVIALSMLLYPDMEKYVRKEDVFVCPNGVPDLNSEEDRNPAEHHGLRLIFLSNLLKNKGVLQLLDGCRILKEKYKLDFSCTFVGGETIDFSRSSFQHEIEERSLQNHVNYAGSRYVQAKSAELQKADLMVFPSRYENECFPLVLLEALSCSLPLIASDEGAIPDIVQEGKTGFILHENSPEEIAEKVMLFVGKSESERVAMRQNARADFKERFTEGQFVRSITKILQQLLEVS